MLTLMLSMVLLAVVMGIMAIGVIFSNKPIKGSCGGMSAMGVGTDCEICGGDTAKCDSDEPLLSNQRTDLAHDATR